MKLIEIADYPFNQVNINWHGPYPWPKESGALKADRDVLAQSGIYRAETAGIERQIIKYIGSASKSFAERLTSQHSIYRTLVPGHRSVRIFLGVIEPENKINLHRKHYVEIEYILQNVHYHDLLSRHGLGKLPKTSRGEGWRITNHGKRGALYRVIAYPGFAVSGKENS